MLWIGHVKPKDILTLRHLVLRPGHPSEAAIFDGDDEKETVHVGVVQDTILGAPFGDCVGCATYMIRPYEGESAWQLRGMASHPAVRGKGIGNALLGFGEFYLRHHRSANLLWCNAREEATGFYERNGWKRVSDIFMVPESGCTTR